MIRESLFETLKSRLAPPSTTTPALVTTPAAPVSDTLVELKFQVKGHTDANLLLAHCEDCDGFRVRAANEGLRRFHNHREGPNYSLLLVAVAVFHLSLRHYVKQGRAVGLA